MGTIGFWTLQVRYDQPSPCYEFGSLAGFIDSDLSVWNAGFGRPGLVLREVITASLNRAEEFRLPGGLRGVREP